MVRVLPVCAALLALPLASPAAETVVRMTVTARPAPTPALKYQLLPELREMNPGNPIHAYLKCFMEQNHFFHHKDSIADREKWSEAPLKELPANLKDYGGGALRQADYAARLDTPDWQILLKLKSDGINLLLPEVQQLRMLASALKVRFRGQVAAGDFEGAVRTAKTMFALARHLGEHPTLIGDLVGIAIAFVAIGPLDEMVQQPGCPNLYWALTDLPRPMIDLRKGLQGERTFVYTEMVPLDDTAPMSEGDLKKVVVKIRKLMGLVGPGGPKEDAADVFRDRARDEAGVRAARARLVQSGLPPERVKQFPALQVVLLEERLRFEVRRDDAMKWLSLPYWQAEAGLAREAEPKEGESFLVQGLLPAYHKVRMAQARLEQRVALLRHVEAVRIYAAENGGKVPAALSDVKVPLPEDPITGKPFHYKVEGKTAVIRGSPPKGQEQSPAYNIRYEVTIK